MEAFRRIVPAVVARVVEPFQESHRLLVVLQNSSDDEVNPIVLCITVGLRYNEDPVITNNI